MNDCWPVASWSSMDYLGRWKALQYYAARSYRDRAVSLYERDGCVEVYVLSDGQNGVPHWSGEVKLALVDFNGTVLSETVIPVEIEPNVSARITSEPIDALLGEHSAQTTLLRATLMVEGQMVDEKFHYFVRAKEQSLPSAVITVKEIDGSNGTQFALSTNELARCVWISSEVDGVFSDNFFDLVPGDTKVVTFHTHNSTLHAFKPASPGALKVTSMVDYVQLM
jgi:beta-mannosidase